MMYVCLPYVTSTGNTALHQITSSGSYELRVDLWAEDETAYAVYDDFRVEAEGNNFRLRLGQYRGNAGKEDNGNLSHYIIESVLVAWDMWLLLVISWFLITTAAKMQTFSPISSLGHGEPKNTLGLV